MIFLMVVKKIKILNITVGISGCGKSRWLSAMDPVVETDDIRKELYEDVNNVDNEAGIFATAKERILNLFHDNDIVYLGATMLQTNYRANYLRSILQESEYDVKIIAYVFPSDPEVSKARIKKDLETKDRADTLFVLESGQTVIDRQYEEYLETLEVIDSENVFESIVYF